MGKTVDMAIFDNLDQSCSFLPGFSDIKNDIAASSDLVITIDTKQTGEEMKLGQKKMAEDHKLVIVVSPTKGVLVPEDVVVTRSRPKYDLVVFLDCSEAERIGDKFEELKDLLFETPTVSIDHHATNSYFAKVNWVDMTAASTTEMLVSLTESLGRNENYLDADVATCLLTGLMFDTGSFQNGNTTPKSLTVAAQLVAAGARQQEIVEKIYMTRSLVTLKLWGKILSNIHEEKENNFVWASISNDEAKKVGADLDTDGTGGVMDELLKTVSGVDFVLMLKENGDSVNGSLRSVDKTFNVSEISKLFGGGGHIVASGFKVKGEYQPTVDLIIEKIKTQLGSVPKATQGVEEIPQS